MAPVRFSLRFKLIQQIRLLHAVAESGWPVAVPAEELPKFSVLEREFALRLAAAGEEARDVTAAAGISHQAPETRFGNLTRPLIFPHAITERCRTLWSPERDVRYSFQGLITPQRQKLLQQWLTAQRLGDPRAVPNQKSPLYKTKEFLLRLAGRTPAAAVTEGGLTIWQSRNGRKFPGKCWDAEYFRLLGRSQFVLCPSGDCVWSYRFFESALCGAMPVAELSCPAYEGFEYYAFDTPAAEMRWCPDRAERNYRLAVQRLTLPREALLAELERLTAA